MKSFLKFFPVIFLSVTIIILVSCKKDKDDNPVEASIMVASDIHLFDTSLLISDGVAFQTYLAQDRKLLKESEAIFNSFIETVLEKKPDVLLLSGDLTKDGERICHEKVALILEEVVEAGIKVIVINGNHDINNPDAMQYDGDTETGVPTVTPEEFTDIYADFGYKDAVARDPNSLSYVSEPADGLVILALDGCRYNPNAVGGSISNETLTWALDQLDNAVEDGKTVIGMVHHGLVEHYTGQKTFFPDYVLDNWESVSDTLIAHGLQVMLTGHYHSHDITAKEFNGNKVYDIETGSTVTWPCPYREINVNDSIISISSGIIEEIEGDMPGGVDFQDYAKQYLISGMTDLAKYMLMAPPYNVPEAYATMLATPFANGFVAHYSGDETPTAQDQADVAMVSSIDATLGAALGSIWTDLQPADKTLTIHLK